MKTKFYGTCQCAACGGYIRVQVPFIPGKSKIKGGRLINPIDSPAYTWRIICDDCFNSEFVFKAATGYYERPGQKDLELRAAIDYHEKVYC